MCLLQISCRSDRPSIHKREVRAAGALINIHFADDKIDTLIPYLERNRKGYDSLRRFSNSIELFPALIFDPLPDEFEFDQRKIEKRPQPIPANIPLPQNLDSLAFYSLPQLASLIKSQKISCLDLTEYFLNRLEQFDPLLRCVITLTTDRARRFAKRADEELEAGIYRGLLHGIPYGVKDLVSVAGYPTTWGAQPYREQQIDYDASVIQQLDAAGAVLVAKLSSGSLARGDVWYEGQTLNPWDTSQGASGSSAGSAAAVAAGLVPFAIGTETLGSITSPSSRCGISGLRPTYGRVSRHGVMSLAWSMDKVGPMAKSAADCAIVFDHMIDADHRDPTLIAAPFHLEVVDPASLRVGYLKEAIEADTSINATNLREALDTLRSLGVALIEKKLPTNFPFAVFDVILRAESGAFFDALIRSPHVDQLVQQGQRSRANSLRQSRFIPAVEYLQANRHRRRLINEMDTVMKNIDVLISPNNAPNQLMITNLTGHPAMSIPTGLDSLDHPTSLTLIAPLFKEANLIQFGSFYQAKTDHEGIPPTVLQQ